MKFKMRRFVFLLIFAALVAYASSKAIQLVYIALGGFAVGYLLSWDDSNYEHKKGRAHV